MATNYMATAAQGYHNQLRQTPLYTTITSLLSKIWRKEEDATVSIDPSTNPSIPPPNGRSGLLELPTELRLMIYEELFASLPKDLEAPGPKQKHLTALLFTNKAIFMEASRTFKRFMQRQAESEDVEDEASEVQEVDVTGPTSQLQASLAQTRRSIRELIGNMGEIQRLINLMMENERREVWVRMVERWEVRIARQFPGWCFCGQCERR